MKFKSLVVFLALTSIAFAQQPQQRRIVRPVSDASVVRLPGTVHPRIANAIDRGAVSPSMPLNRMMMVLSPSPEQQAALDQLLAEQQDPNSPNYHKWLTPEEFADRFGLAQADIDVVSAWLTSQGFMVEEVARARDWIAFSGIAAQVEAAFHAPLHNYLVRGNQHFAASTDISVPDAFAGVVSGVTGLHDFAPRALNVKPRPEVTSSITGNHFVVPGDFATIYNLPSYTNVNDNPPSTTKSVPCTGITTPCLDGTNQTIAVVGQSDLSTDSNPGRNGTPGVNGQQYDIVTFRNLAGLPAVNLTIKLTGTDPGIVSGDVDEANLDLEWAGAAAPNAALIYYIENSNNGGAFQALVDAANDNKAQVISVSYGNCEGSLDANTQSQLTSAGQKANAQGQAIVVASGDSGAADCDSSLPATHGLSVDFPSSMPYSTAVGGTTFTGDSTNSTDPTQSTQFWAGSTNDVGNDTAPSAYSYVPETAWNDSSGATPAASGGGASAKFSKPSWQAGPGVPADGARDVPDVALNGSASHDFTVICSQSSCVNGYRKSDASYTVIGGTSVGTPQFAGILALLNQAKGGPPQGNPNSQLYPLAASATTSWAFNDVTTGNNIVTCTGGTGCNNGSMGYSAGTGYDLVTGLGSVDATALIDALTNSVNPHFQVLPASHNVSLSPNSSSPVAVSVPSKEGFTGNVALTCTVSSSLTGVTCSYGNTSPVSVTPSTPGSATLTVQAGSQAPQTGTVTLQGNGTEAVTLAVSVGVQDFQLTYGNLSTGGETVNTGGSATDTITITPLMGFAGTVNFSCAETSGYGSGLTCSLNPSSVSSSSYTSTLTVNASGTATTGAVTVTATSGSITHNRVIPVTVNAVASSFTLTVASPVVSIPSGGMITDNLTVAAVGAFNSTVALTCSVPSSLGNTTCSINPSTAPGGNGTSVITINGAVVGHNLGAPFPFNHRGYGAISIFALALGMVFSSRRERRITKRALRNGLFGMFLLAVAMSAMSCGGGGGGSNGHTPLTGNITITGTGGGITQTATINVTVQ